MSKFILDLRGDNAETMDSGGAPVPGWYAVRLEDVYQDNQAEDTTVLEFLIVEGAFTNRKLFYRFAGPDSAADDAKLKIIINRIKMLASRMGIISETDADKEVEIDFVTAVGWEGVVQFEERQYTGDDGALRTTRSIGYSAVYPAGHKDLAKKQLPAKLKRFAPAADAASSVTEKKPRGRKPPAAREPAAAGVGAGGANGTHGDIPLDDI